MCLGWTVCAAIDQQPKKKVLCFDMAPKKVKTMTEEPTGWTLRHVFFCYIYGMYMCIPYAWRRPRVTRPLCSVLPHGRPRRLSLNAFLDL